MFIIEERRISNPFLIYLDERTRRRKEGERESWNRFRSRLIVWLFCSFWMKRMKMNLIMEGRYRDKYFLFFLYIYIYICMSKDAIGIAIRERKRIRKGNERKRIGELTMIKRRIELQFQDSLLFCIENRQVLRRCKIFRGISDFFNQKL